MLNKRTILTLGLTMLLAAPQFWTDASAQQFNPNVTMTLYQVVRKDGKQYIISKSGQPVSVPGLNIAPNATQISVYRDTSNNFWYIDANGQPVAITHDQLQWVATQVNPQQQPQNVTNNYYGSGSNGSSNNNSGGGGGSALMTGVAAATGAAIGTSLSQPNYYGVPYGTPMYRNPAGGYYYHNAGGNQVTVNHTTELNNVSNEWNSQTNYNDMARRANVNSGNFNAANAGEGRRRRDGDVNGAQGDRRGRGDDGNNGGAGDGNNGRRRRGGDGDGGDGDNGRRRRGGDGDGGNAGPGMTAGDDGGRRRGDGDGGGRRDGDGGGRRDGDGGGRRDGDGGGRRDGDGGGRRDGDGGGRRDGDGGGRRGEGGGRHEGGGRRR